MSKHAISLEDIRRAAHLLSGIVHRTPALENLEVNALLAGRLLLKAENLQRTGAFKIRGAYNRISRMSAPERARGVARAAQMLGLSAIIVMPSDMPEAKMQATRALGAEIAIFERDTQDSAEIVAAMEAETGRIEVPPSAYVQVLAGAGTAGLELLEDAGKPDTVLVPCGGGLTAATAMSWPRPYRRHRCLQPSPSISMSQNPRTTRASVCPIPRANAPFVMRS